ncbi:MAG TPA: hypothetical protein PKX94_09730, partial [Opitutales bacterium]|nr:hypothetical protein [Opitutales bacterium]
DITCGGGDPFAVISAGSMFIGVNDILYMVPASQISGCTPPCTLTPLPITTNLPGNLTVTGLGFEYDGDLWIGEYANFFTGQMIRVNPCNAATALSTITGLGLTVELTGNIGLATTPAFLTDVQIEGRRISWKSLNSAGVIGYNVFALSGEKWSKLNNALIQVDWNRQNTWQQFTVQADHEILQAAVAIEALDVYGNREVHGPFEKNEDRRGMEIRQIDWPRIGRELDLFERTRDVTDSPYNSTVKMKIDHEGWYRVTWEDLSELIGHTSEIPIKRLSLTRDHDPVPVFVVSRDDYFGPGDSIEFLGHLRDSIYGSSETYLLSLGSEGKFVRTGIVNSNTDPATQAEVCETYRDNVHYSFSSPFSDPWYLESLLALELPITRT